MESHMFQFVPIACPVTWQTTEKNPYQLHSLPSGIFYALRFPTSLLSSRLKSSSSISLSSVRCSKRSVISVALHHTHFSKSWSSLYCRAQNWTRYFRHSLTSSEQRARATSLSPLAMSGTLSVLSAQCFLVLHVFGNAFQEDFLHHFPGDGSEADWSVACWIYLLSPSHQDHSEITEWPHSSISQLP